MNRNERILVTGGFGFLGSCVVARLNQLGYSQVVSPSSAEFDLRQQAEVRELVSTAKPDVVIHLAARVGGIGANQDNPGQYLYENAIMGLMLMEESRRYGSRKFVTIGTICSYPKFTPVPFRESELWNGYPEETNAPYGLAKKLLLVQGQAYRKQYGFNVIHLLPVNLYGPGDNFDQHLSHVIPALIRKCVEAVESGSPEVDLWGDGSPTREFLYVTEAARAVVMAMEQYDEADPINIGSGKEISIRDLAELIAKLTGFSGEFRWSPDKPNGQPRRCLDLRRAKEKLGFESAIELEPGLISTIEWYRNTRAQGVAIKATGVGHSA